MKMEKKGLGMFLSLIGVYIAYSLAQVTSYETFTTGWKFLLLGVLMYFSGILSNSRWPNAWSSFCMYLGCWAGFGLWLGFILNQFRDAGAWIFSTGVACALVADTTWLLISLFLPNINEKFSPWVDFLVFSIVAQIVNVNFNSHGLLAIKLGTFPYLGSPLTVFGHIFVVAWSVAILWWLQRSSAKLAEEGVFYGGLAPIKPYSSK